MTPSRQIRPLSDLGQDARRLVRDAVASRSPVYLTERGRATAVLLDIRSFERLDRTSAMEMLVAQGVADADAGRAVPLREAFQRTRRKLRRGA